MGCDGGTIPKRDELVRLKKKPEQKDKDAERSFKWRNCTLSQQRLQEPIVACGLGRLYSKSSILESLLDKETKPESIAHIKNLKDVKDLKLIRNPSYVETERAGGAVDEGSAPYICPISGLEMAGRFPFVFLWTCGCVLAERTLREVKQDICHMCQMPFTSQDVVILNGTNNDIEELKIKMANRNANRKSSKKSKTIKAEVTDVPCSSSTETVDVKTEIVVKDEPTVGTSQDTTKPIQSQDTTKSEDTTKPIQGQDTVETIPLTLPIKSKQPRGPIVCSKRVHSKNLVEDPSYKKSKKDYSVAKDPKSSEVYKSIFTSHKNDKEQQRAHWVTYNPFYN